MDNYAMYELGRVLYEDRLREAESREQLWRSSRFRRLPRLLQALLAVLS
jgi:hypothetical protein